MNEETGTDLRSIGANAVAVHEVAAERRIGARRLIEDAIASRGDLPWLSLRERDVLNLVARGLSDKEIATQMGVSTATVNTHLRHVYAKLRANNRAHAVAIALRYGVLTLQLGS